MRWQYDDGGRQQAGYKGSASDCSCRAISIALQLSYADVYAALNVHAKAAATKSRKKRHGSARTGVSTKVLHGFLHSHGWTWTPTVRIGTGCVVHLTEEELPAGRLIVRLSKHMVAVVDRVIHDTHDPSRDGTRCVYGYWRNNGT